MFNFQDDKNIENKNQFPVSNINYNLFKDLKIRQLKGQRS